MPLVPLILSSYCPGSLPHLFPGFVWVRFGEPKPCTALIYFILGFIHLFYSVSCLAPPSFLALHIVHLSFVPYPYPYMFGFSPCSSNSNFPLFLVFLLRTLWTPRSRFTSYPPSSSDFLYESPGCHACSERTDALLTTTPDVHWKQLHREENSAGRHHSCHMLQLQVEAFVSLDPSPPFARLEP